MDYVTPRIAELSTESKDGLIFSKITTMASLGFLFSTSKNTSILTHGGGAEPAPGGISGVAIHDRRLLFTLLGDCFNNLFKLNSRLIFFGD